ncbi:MAG: peptidoglycan-binding domain-containing protein [Candidatus Tectomicrobia bacterium]|nr:peptidoglycan-binding domain-containing protein [Candidatus Tectomicrobia bacterium]
MGRRKAAVRILVCVAGGLGVALVIFVGIPWVLELLEPVPEAQMTDEEIVRHALDSLVEEVVDRALEGEQEPQASAAEEETTSAPEATRDSGETLPVVFPRSEEAADEAAALPGPESERLAVLGTEPPARVLIPGQMDAVIPVAAPAPPDMPDPSEETASVGTLVAGAHEGVSHQSPQRAPPAGQTVHMGRTAGVPPPGAVRELQELLRDLGYDPGRADGVWGPRTERAWRSFMKDAGAPPGPEASAPSSEPEDGAVSGAAQAGLPPPGLRDPERSVVVPGTLRGVMGYRLPLVSRQEVPDQVVSGALMPAHTTFVILRPGYWELTGLTPEEVKVLERTAAGARERPLPVKPPVLSPGENWTLLRMLGLERPASERK